MSYENLKAPRLVKISSCVMNALNETNIYSMDQYERLMQIGMLGVKQLYLHHVATPEVIYTPVTSNGIIDLPDDFVDYYKIGIRRNGQVWTLTLNNNLLLPRQRECALRLAEEAFNDNAVEAYTYAPHWYDGVYYTALYGASGGLNDGYFRYDEEYNQLVVSGLATGTELVIEYKSNGLSRDGYISARAEMPLIEWIHWRRKAHDETKKYTLNEIGTAKGNFLEAVSEMRTEQYSFTEDEFLDTIYETSTLAPKR